MFPFKIIFISPGPGVPGVGIWVPASRTETDLTDMTLADEDSNSIPTDTNLIPMPIGQSEVNFSQFV